MNILIIVIPFSLLLGLGFVFAFLWATSKGQFDDTETPALRILFDEDNKKERKDIHGKHQDQN